MANYVTNDYGKNVLAIGAPGSIARAEVEHPLKIAALKELHANGGGKNEAIRVIMENGVSSRLEINSILHHTPFSKWE
jgi:hypothetical protein